MDSAIYGRRSLKRPLLYLLVGSVILGAGLGIIVVLRNQWGWLEIRVILTTIILAVASLCGLACDLSRTPRGANLLPRGGLALTFVAACLLLFGIWTDLDGEIYWKTTASSAILALATVHVCLLSIARLARRFRAVYFIATQVIYGLAFLLIAMLVGEIENERLFRFVAVLSIVAVALSLVIPLLHRISKTDLDAALPTPLEERNLAALDTEIAHLERHLTELQALRASLAQDVRDSAR